MAQDLKALNDKIKEHSGFVPKLFSEIGKVIVGQKYLVERLIIGLLANGHILIEGVPGLAKTASVKTLSQTIDAKFQRIQFTPDLLPADLIGTLIYNPKDGNFLTKKGPIFANIILADEINRAPAKVQSALLEAMQERQVTIGENTFKLDDPFLVLATQNPIEQEGTYPLPEAQVDRFMLKLKITYPSKEEEKLIMERMSGGPAISVNRVVELSELLRAREAVSQIYIDERIKNYIVEIVMASRNPEAYHLNLKGYILYGASPRATINLNMAAKAHAFLNQRGYVIPEDVKAISLDVLRHRILVTYEAEAEEVTSEQVIQKIFEGVPVP